MEAGHHYNEKRLYCRMDVDAEVTYTVPDDSNEYRGQCRNLSYSGIQFDTEHPLPEGKTVKVTIDTKSEKFQPAQATVEVLRVESAENDQYRIAGKILEFK